MSTIDLTNLNNIAHNVRYRLLKTIATAGTGHSGACCSSTELMTVLYFGHVLKYSNDPDHPDRDFVLARGHVGPLRYNIFNMLGWMNDDEMLQYRQFGTRMAGHEDMHLTPGVDLTPSGSLGMLLSYACGARYSFKKRGKRNRMFCFLGDGESQEGNVSEAARYIGHIGLDGIIVVIDNNKKQLSTAAKYVDSCDLDKLWSAYGFEVIVINDGHDVQEVKNAYDQATKLAEAGPVCIIANTIKGMGIPNAETHYNGYHAYHKSVGDEVVNDFPLEEAVEEWGKNLPSYTVDHLSDYWLDKPESETTNRQFIIPQLVNNECEENSFEYLYEYFQQLNESRKTATNNFYFMCADYPPRAMIYGSGQFNLPEFDYMNVGIREQHLVAMAHGISVVEPDAIVFLFCGDPFMYRCADQVNVLAQSNDNVIIYATNGGLSGAKNGFTHQSVGQPGCFMTMPGIQVYEPSSKEEWHFAMNRAFTESGPKYIRVHKTFGPYSLGTMSGNYSMIASGSAFTAISCGMVINEVVEANKLSSVKGTVISLVSLKELDGLANLIVPNRPLYIFYNGNVRVISSEICRQLVLSNKQISDLVEIGFDKGRTGGIRELMEHYGMDRNSIQQLFEKN